MRFGIGAISSIRPKFLRIRLRPVNDFAMSYPHFPSHPPAPAGLSVRLLLIPPLAGAQQRGPPPCGPPPSPAPLGHALHPVRRTNPPLPAKIGGALLRTGGG